MVSLPATLGDALHIAIQGGSMFEGLFQPMHLLVIFGIALLVFGPKKLPELGKGIGEGIRGLRSAMKDQDDPAGKITTPPSSSSTYPEVVTVKAASKPNAIWRTRLTRARPRWT